MKISHNYLLILLLAFLIIQGCNVVYKVSDITGVYINKWYDTQHELKLHKDNTFIFYVKEGLYTDTIKGEWKFEGKRLLLEAKDNKPFYKTSECDTCSKNYLIVYDIQNTEKMVAFYKAYVKGTLKKEGDTDLLAELPENTDSLYIESLGYSSLGFKIVGNKNKIEVFLSKTGGNLLKNKFYIKGEKIKSSNGLILEKTIN